MIVLWWWWWRKRRRKSRGCLVVVKKTTLSKNSPPKMYANYFIICSIRMGNMICCLNVCTCVCVCEYVNKIEVQERNKTKFSSDFYLFFYLHK